LSEELAIYGFGSYFCGHSKFSDIDILIVHRFSDYESCKFAIRCKRFFVSNLAESDITMLSNREEQQISFVVKSIARHIGNVHKESEETDLREILGSIMGWPKSQGSVAGIGGFRSNFSSSLVMMSDKSRLAVA